MIIESSLLTEGLFGQSLNWMLDLLPYLDRTGQKPAWIIKNVNFGEPPVFNIFPSVIQTAYTPESGPGDVSVSFEELLTTHTNELDTDFCVAHEYWTKFFRFTADVEETVAAFCGTPAFGDDVLGVHYRGTDKNRDPEQTNPVSGAEFLVILADFLETRDNIKTIFVATDDFYFVELMEAFVRDQLTVLTHLQPRSRNDRPLFMHHDTSENERFAKDAILDCLTLSRCRYLLSCMSGLSAFAKVLNPNLEAYRVSACKPPWFPSAYIPRYCGSGEAARALLRILQRDDWEDPAGSRKPGA